MHAFSPSSREEYQTGGDRSQTQSHSEDSGGRIAIFWTEVSKSPWLTVLLF